LRGGNPGIFSVRETAVHRWLERKRSPMHVPGSVLKLSLKQVTTSALNGGIAIVSGDRDSQSVNRLAGRERVTAIRAIAPNRHQDAARMQAPSPTVAILKRVHRPRKAQQLIHAVLAIMRLHAPQPFARAIDLFCELNFLSGQRISLQRVDGQGGSRPTSLV